MELYIVRHGQSQSQTGTEMPDPPLTETGLLQARLTGQALQNVRFDFAYASHLTRAVQTAAAILQYQQSLPTLNVLPELTECGSRNHVCDPEALRALYPDMRVAADRCRPFDSDADRAAFCLEQCVYKNAYEGPLDIVSPTGDGELRRNDVNVLIVCHGVFNAHLIGQLVHFPFDRNVIVSQHNACINRFSLFTVNGVRRLRFKSFNSVAHLPEDLLT